MPRVLSRAVTFALICAVILLGCAVAPEHPMRQVYLNHANQHPPELIDAIKKGEIFIGMDTTAVRASWGVPNKINSSGGRHGSAEQWVYGYADYYYNFVPVHYVYFENGKVTDWQTFRQ
jgi:hypothetical protein